MSRYFRETKIRIFGDKREGQAFVTRARKQLGLLIEDMSFNKLQVGVRRSHFGYDSRNNLRLLDTKSVGPGGEVLDRKDPRLKIRTDNGTGQSGAEPFQVFPANPDGSQVIPAFEVIARVLPGNGIVPGMNLIDIYVPVGNKEPYKYRDLPLDKWFIALCDGSNDPNLSDNSQGRFYYLIEPYRTSGEMVCNANSWNFYGAGGNAHLTFCTWEIDNDNKAQSFVTKGSSWRDHVTDLALYDAYLPPDYQLIDGQLVPFGGGSVDYRDPCANYSHTTSGAICFPPGFYASYLNGQLDYPESLVKISSGGFVGDMMPTYGFAVSRAEKTIETDVSIITTGSWWDGVPATNISASSKGPLDIGEEHGKVLAGYYVLCGMNYAAEGDIMDPSDMDGAASIIFNGQRIEEKLEYKQGSSSITGGKAGSKFYKGVTLIDIENKRLLHYDGSQGDIFAEIFSLSNNEGSVPDTWFGFGLRQIGGPGAPVNATPNYKVNPSSIIGRYEPTVVITHPDGFDYINDAERVIKYYTES